MTNFKPSGFDWIGDIPFNWAVSRFRHVFRESKEVNGTRPVGEMLSVSGYKGVVPKVYESDSLKRDDDQLETYRVVRKGQLAVNTMWLNYAGLGISEFEGHMSPAYRAYWVSKKVHGRYMHHLLRSKIYVNAYTSYLTGVRPNSLQMSRDNLMSFPILLPPIEVQKAIADFLDRKLQDIDQLVEAQRALRRLCNERRSALIDRATTIGLDRKVELSATNSQWLPKIPSHWQFAPASSLFASRNEPNQSDDVHLTPSQTHGVMPQAEYMEITGNRVVLNLTGADKMRHVEAGDFISHLRSFQGGLEFTGHVGKVSAAYTVLRPKTPLVHDYYRFLFKSQSYIRGLSTTTEQLRDGQSIRYQQFKLLKLPCPPIAEQHSIVEFLSEELPKYLHLETKAKELELALLQRREALINSVVTGKIDIRGKK